MTLKSLKLIFQPRRRIGSYSKQAAFAVALLYSEQRVADRVVLLLSSNRVRYIITRLRIRIIGFEDRHEGGEKKNRKNGRKTISFIVYLWVFFFFFFSEIFSREYK